MASKLLTFQQSESKFVWILIAVFALILLNPLLPNQGWGAYVFRLLLLFIVVSGILAASNERQLVQQLTLLGLGVTALDWIQALARRDFPELALVVYALYAIFVAFITVAIILAVVRSTRVTVNVICGAIAGYLLIGLSGMFIALLLEGITPGHFLAGGAVLGRAGLAEALLYYSMVSLSTIGYGDITPVSPAARSLSLAIGLLGQIYLTVLVAMLVGKYLKD